MPRCMPLVRKLLANVDGSMGRGEGRYWELVFPEVGVIVAALVDVLVVFSRLERNISFIVERKLSKSHHLLFPSFALLGSCGCSPPMPSHSFPVVSKKALDRFR